MKKECQDCKYCNGKECINIYLKYCKHCELWTPKWFRVETDEKECAE